MAMPAPDMLVTRARHVREALRESLPDYGVLVFESHHAPDFSMQWRTHAFLKVVFFLQGAGVFDVADRHVEFASGDVVVVPAGTRNRIRDKPGQPVSLYAACIASRILRDHTALETALTIRHLRGGSRSTVAIASTLRRMVHRQDQEPSLPAGLPSMGVDLLIHAWRLIRAVADFDRVTSPPVGRDPSGPPGEEPDRPAGGEFHERAIIARYVEQLPKTFLEATTIDAAADSLGLSRRTFTRLFREESSSTWLQTVRRIGIEHAAKLLRETNLPITSVAFESGYCDLSTFYRRFAKTMRVSPATYRLRHRSASDTEERPSLHPRSP